MEATEQSVETPEALLVKPSALPQIALSVDMLDTGIDIPEIVNLVFFNLVRSKTKFWQMVGRGTRLRSDLFGPGQDKQFFFIFDYCQNLEFFSQNPPLSEGRVGESLGARLFTARVELVAAVDERGSQGMAAAHTGDGPPGAELTDQQVRTDTAALLREQVAAMNPDNFVVRPKRRWVEQYAREDAWTRIGNAEVTELSHHLAALPTALVDEDEEAKRFDLLMLNLQLAILRAEPTYDRLRERVRSIVELLLEQGSIPAVREQMPLIEAVAGEEWWEGVTVPRLEVARRRLRALMKLIEKSKRKPVYADFEDELGPETVIDLPHLQPGTNVERFRAKALQFLSSHDNHITIHKVRFNQPLTSSDLDELERMMLEARVGTREDFARAKEQSNGFGLFIRSLVGLDRQAAKEALGGFLSASTASANQIEFVNLIVDHLTEHGLMDPALLYESPFIDKSPHGPEALFSSEQVDGLVAVLRDIHQRAAA
jgi:type I restriction enzyme, R subunit